MIPMETHRIVRLASSPGVSGGDPPLLFWAMLWAATSLMFWSVSAGLPPLTGMGTDFGSPAWGWRPLVIMLIRKVGSRLFFPLIVVSIGLRVGPIPPSRLTPWHEVQFAV